ncbi:MAG TPA: shikimate dehydrogenase [Xanthobacteraceae bacterium]|nr:shikimate dehydrogenase [Xanthobacteraceae bacterium]
MLPSLNGETRLHLIVGDPVGQTKSPSGLTGEFVARGANAICVPVQVAASDFDAFMDAAKRGQNIDGIVITIPHKFAALRHCDEASDRARFLGAANVLRRIAGDRWHGDMTDGAAMVAALRRAGCEPGGRRALIIGAGGAGSAVALALIEAGAATLAVADMDEKRCQSLVKRLAIKAPAVAQAGTPDPAGFGLVVNATPAGMQPADPLPLDAARLESSAYVADLITRPTITPLLKAARRRGCKVVTGEDMFAVQAGDMADILLAPPAF